MALPIIKIENAQGEVLNLSTDPRYIPMLQNTGPVAATINTTKAGTNPGETINSVSLGKRNLLLTVDLIRDIAQGRLNLYNWLSSGEYIKVYYSNDGLNVYAEGYIENAPVDPWTQQQSVAASIICPIPYWRELSETFTDGSNVKSLFEFPFSIAEEGIELSTVDTNTTTKVQNKGTAACGIRFELIAMVYTVNPRIYNLETNDYIGFNLEMQAGDRLIVNTALGQKSVTLLRNGVKSNYMHTLMPKSEWLQLSKGFNEFAYVTDEGDIKLHIYHTNQYTGV